MVWLSFENTRGREAFSTLSLLLLIPLLLFLFFIFLFFFHSSLPAWRTQCLRLSGVTLLSISLRSTFLVLYFFCFCFILHHLNVVGPSIPDLGAAILGNPGVLGSVLRMVFLATICLSTFGSTVILFRSTNRVHLHLSCLLPICDSSHVNRVNMVS